MEAEAGTLCPVTLAGARWQTGRTVPTCSCSPSSVLVLPCSSPIHFPWPPHRHQNIPRPPNARLLLQSPPRAPGSAPPPKPCPGHNVRVPRFPCARLPTAGGGCSGCASASGPRCLHGRPASLRRRALPRSARLQGRDGCRRLACGQAAQRESLLAPRVLSHTRPNTPTRPARLTTAAVRGLPAHPRRARCSRRLQHRHRYRHRTLLRRRTRRHTPLWPGHGAPRVALPATHGCRPVALRRPDRGESGVGRRRCAGTNA